MSYLRTKNKPNGKKLNDYKMIIIENLSENIFVEESIKRKSCLEVYGLLESTTKLFDQQFINIFFNFVH
jgi:hypothetical protein